MVNQHKSLGKFKLNSILNVTANDLGTGKHQEIIIQGSSNMSRDEIDRAVREAQQYAAEDAKAKDEAAAKDITDDLSGRK